MISSALFIFQPTQSIGSFSRPILKANQLWLRETNKLLPSLPQLLQPTNEIQACNLGRKHLERIWSNICSCLANAILNQKGNVWLYKGCLIDREAKIRLDSNVGGLCYICIIHQVLTTDPFIDSPPPCMTSSFCLCVVSNKVHKKVQYGDPWLWMKSF